MRIPSRNRAGFTALEVTVSLAVLATAIAFAAELVTFGIAERRRNLAHQAAVETATNVLEAARGCAWDKLDDTWAEAQQATELPPRLAEAKVRVTIEKAELPGVKRVTVEVEPQHGPRVRQSAWFAAREGTTGGQP
jgi:prepilin-type N-terminal cleavage/methylation domain-containing protein